MNQKPVENGQVSRKAKKLQHCRQHLIQEELHSCRQPSHVEGAATSFLLRFHADEIISYPSARIIPISQNKTFEELLLDQVKQMTHVRTGRKRICGRAETITSGEVSGRMKETVSKKCERQEQTRKKKTTKKKRKQQQQQKKIVILNPSQRFNGCQSSTQVIFNI
jgi:hypothetical protein